MNKFTYWVEGTTCHSCELMVEQAWKKLPAIDKIVVNGVTGEANILTVGDAPTIQTLQQALAGTHYKVHEAAAALPTKRPSWKELIGLFALVLFLGYILSKLGIFQSSINLGTGLSFGAVFVIGLVAASSSCIAVVGGLLLSSAARFNERYASLSRSARMRPVVFFVLGRSVSYAILGGLLGVIGNFLTPSPIVTAIIIIIAAGYMIIMGLDMLRLAPKFLKRLMPSGSKNLSHKILAGHSREHWGMPFVLGAATFFLPCGFTQALQLYALTTHSFWTSAGLMLAFSLGTAPALLALGYASGSVKGKVGQWLFKFSGALVIVLGFWNISNGFAIAGFSPKVSSNTKTAVAAASGVKIENGVQVAKMNVYGGYTPNHFIVKVGVPVRWEIQGSNSMGCLASLVSRQLGVRKFLSSGLNEIYFTPKSPGEIAFSCSMGMYRGSFTVVK